MLYLLKPESKHSHCFLLISCFQLLSPFWKAQPCYFVNVNIALSAVLLSPFVFSFLSLHAISLICFGSLLALCHEMRCHFLALSNTSWKQCLACSLFLLCVFFSLVHSLSHFYPLPSFLPLCLSQRTMSECFSWVTELNVVSSVSQRRISNSP